MSNIQKLAANGNKNHRLFAATIVDLMHSQGFYGRLYRAVNEMDDIDYSTLYSELEINISTIRLTSYFGWSAVYA